MEEENNKRACVADNDTTWKTNAFDKGKIKPAHHKERKKERKKERESKGLRQLPSIGNLQLLQSWRKKVSPLSHFIHD